MAERSEIKLGKPFWDNFTSGILTFFGKDVTPTHYEKLFNLHERFMSEGRSRDEVVQGERLFRERLTSFLVHDLTLLPAPRKEAYVLSMEADLREAEAKYEKTHSDEDQVLVELYHQLLMKLRI